MNSLTLDNAYYIGVARGSSLSSDYSASPDGRSVFVRYPGNGSGVIVTGLESVYVLQKPEDFVNFNMYSARNN